MFGQLATPIANRQQFLRVILKTARLRASTVSFIIFGIFGSIVLVFWYGAHLMEARKLTFGELTRFILYTTFRRIGRLICGCVWPGAEGAGCDGASARVAR